MKEIKRIEKSIRTLRVKTSDALDERILADASAALAESSEEKQARKQTNLRRIIMKSNWTKFAAAAAVIVAVVILWVSLVNKSATPAYALEQTIQANHSVRSIHIKKYMPANEQPEEYWAEFDETGQLYRCRINMPETADGPKEIVWQDNKIEIWLEAKNMYGIIKDKSVSEHLRQTMEEIDPKLAVLNLQQLQSEGTVRIEIAEPSRTDEPIIVTATCLENSRAPGRRLVLTVDSTTKLVEQIEVYQLIEGDYQHESRLEIKDYNQPIDPTVFTLEAPEDAIRIDQTNQQIGLAQGNLSDNEIAVKVVRELLEALIAKDYSKASRLYQGIPVSVLEKHLASKTLIRIMSIGEPKPSKWNKLLVPCKYEVEENGKKFIVQSNAYVRRVFGEQDRWTCDGGI